MVLPKHHKLTFQKAYIEFETFIIADKLSLKNSYCLQELISHPLMDPFIK